MKLFLDTADLKEIEQAFAYRLLDGVTTNPALLAKQSLGYREGVQKICALVGGAAIFAEVLADRAEEMVREAKEIRTWGPDIVIKLPTVPEGIRACGMLSAEGIPCTMTLVYTESQAILAAKAGARYVAPFAGRANDVGIDGLQTIRNIAETYRALQLPTEILAASIRTAAEAAAVLRAGCTAVTLPFGVLMGMMECPLTDNTLSTFLDLWQSKNTGGVF